MQYLISRLVFRSLFKRKTAFLAPTLKAMLACVGLVFAGLTSSAYSIELASEQTRHTRVSILSGYDVLVPGGVQYFALSLQPEDGWHTYWRNPGEVGKATSLEWELPKGVYAGELEWPMPVRKEELGGISFVYPGDVLLPFAVAVGEQLDFDQDEQRFTAEVSWLVCKDVCIPESATLNFSMPVAFPGAEVESLSNQDDERIKAIAGTIPRLRRDVIAEFNADIAAKPPALAIEVELAQLPAFHTKPAAYLAEQGIVDETQLARIVLGDEHLTILFNADPYLEELPPFFALVLSGFDQASTPHLELHVEHNPDLVVGNTTTAPSFNNQSLVEDSSSSIGLALVLLFAFFGGLILNAMPCVFPVLSLKVIGLIESGAGDAKHRQSHGLAYTAGVVISFVLVALVLIVLRALGEQIGWGFQLQSPLFVASMALLLFVLGLSLSGFIEIGSNLQNVGAGRAHQSEHPLKGAFWTGVLATVVATPCTAPFMGSAMGYALGQPVAVSLLVFTVMGLGLASPFLLVAFVPVLGDWLPKPGNWMVRFKELLAFPLYLTAVWLLWVFARQQGVNAAAILLVAVVLIAMAVWAWRSGPFGRWSVWRFLAVILAAMSSYTLYLASAQAPSQLASESTGSPDTASTDANDYVAYSDGALKMAIDAGETVLVNMTADWCITCKVNERVALKNERVAKALGANGVTYIKGDWTNSDPLITEYLSRFGRNGVPLYVVYQKGRSPKVLPQILTPDLVLEALR